MKAFKSFIIFVVIFQTILTLGHWLLYLSLIFFFPWFAPYHQITLISLLLLSTSFLIVTVLDFKYDGLILRIIYLLFSFWAILWFYLLMAAGASLIIFLIVPSLNLTQIALPLFILAVGLVIYGIINARIIRTIKLKINLPNLPAYWKNKIVVVASDIHLGHILRRGTAEKVTKKINSLNPDIVFIPGDVFDGVHTNFTALVSPFKNLNPLHGVYFSSGNHELYAGMRQCEQAILDANIKILENQKLEIEGLQIAGLAYASGQNNQTITEAMQKLNLNKNLPSILLKHVPAQIPLIANFGVSLMLSGHTHQGQVWPGPLVTKAVWKGFGYGLKKIKDMQIYTSCGVGTWGPPVRIFTKSEIVKIELI